MSGDICVDEARRMRNLVNRTRPKLRQRFYTYSFVLLQISPVAVVVDIVLPTLISYVSHTAKFKQTSPSYDTVKKNVVLLVLMIVGLMILSMAVC